MQGLMPTLSAALLLLVEKGMSRYVRSFLAQNCCFIPKSLSGTSRLSLGNQIKLSDTPL